MKCPRDGTVLAKVKTHGIELDKCHQCDGIWFDYQELDQLRDLKVSDIEQQIEREYGDPSYKPEQVDGYMRCPRCDDGRLQGITYTYFKPVRIDRCESCLGVWLDNDELTAIVGEKQKLDKEFSEGRVRVFLRTMGQVFKSQRNAD